MTKQQFAGRVGAVALVVLLSRRAKICVTIPTSEGVAPQTPSLLSQHSLRRALYFSKSHLEIA